MDTQEIVGDPAVEPIAGAAAGGILWGARFPSVDARAATGYELLVVAAVVLGGVNIFGGSGTVLGAILGAIFLGIVAILPFFATKITGINALQLSATSLLIVVGVAIDTMRQLEAQLMMRNYEGFID